MQPPRGGQREFMDKRKCASEEVTSRVGDALPLIVGETNPYGSCAEFALYPAPRGCAGWRLCNKVLALDSDDYLERFERVNLCDGPWRDGKARESAEQFWHAPARTFLLLGSRVCAAFGVEFLPFTTMRIFPMGHAVVVLPHPSGRSRYWNDPLNYLRARDACRIAGVL